MNPIGRVLTGKKSRTNGSSLYMYCQTPQSLLNRKSNNKKGIRSYSNKRERVVYVPPKTNNKIIELSDSKSRKGLNN